MAEKNANKFPYIVLPSLSEGPSISSASKPIHPTATGSKSTSHHIDSFQQSQTQLPQLKGSRAKDPSAPRPLTSSKMLSRHIGLSKQFAMTAVAAHSKSGKSDKEIQSAQRKMLLAHYEMRKSPRSLYPSGTASETSVFSASKDCNKDSIKSSVNESTSLGISQTYTLNSEPAARKASLEALGQIFPHRTQTNVQQHYTLKPDHISEPSRRDKASDIKLDAPSHITEISKKHNNHPHRGAGDPGNFTEEQLKVRLDGLTVHVKSRDEEISQLKQDLIDLQLLVLKERKETEKSNSVIRQLLHEIGTMDRKLVVLQKTVECQEKNIIDKLLLLDGMESLSDSDSDCGKTEKKQCGWKAGSPTPSHNTTPPQTNQSSGVGLLKECLNWVPVAPDFDKLLNIIGLLNFRMDRNQSMKLSRKGNEASFKHADTINLAIYKNGLILGKSGFRSYATLSVIKLINEMFNGYFPTELHAQYPDGVIFVVSDRRAVYHDMNAGFCGLGVKLSDSQSAPILIPGAEKFPVKKNTELVNTKLAEETLSCTSVTSTFSACSSSSYISLTDLPTLNENSNSCPANDKMIVLKLKDTVTGKMYKLKASTLSKIDEIILHIENFVGGHTEGESRDSERKSTKYDLVLPVPYGILTSGTLKDYGMVQNTLLYIQPHVTMISHGVQVDKQK